MSTTITFNGYSLQSTTILSQIDVGNVNMSYDLKGIPYKNGSLVSDKRYDKRTITIEGVLKGASASNLETLLKEFKQKLNGASGNLDVTRRGTTLRYKATHVNPGDMIKEEFFNTTWVKFTLQFICEDPFAYETSPTEYNGSQNSGSATYTVSNGGTADCYPQVTIFNIPSSVSSVDLINNTTGEQFRVMGGFTGGDYVDVEEGETGRVIDSTSTTKDWVGYLPRLASGSNSLTLTFNGRTGTDTAMLILSYYERYF